MLSAAYALFGRRMENNHIHVPVDLHVPRSDLRIKQLWVKGERRRGGGERVVWGASHSVVGSWTSANQ